MRKIRILFFIYEMGAGGAARTLLNILNHIDKDKFEPILVTLNYNGNYEKHLNPDVKFIKLEANRLRSAILPLAKVIRKERAHIVFSTIPVYNTIAIVARLLSFTQAKNVVREAAFLGGTFSANIQLLVYGLFYRFSSKVISLSEGVKQNLINRYKIKASNIEVIYNPVDISNIIQQASSGSIAREHQSIFSGKSKVIITAGRLVDEKDHQTLLHAFAKVSREIDSDLFILGEGALKEDLTKLAQKLHIHNKVHFIGFMENPYTYFKKAELFVLSSKNEGFGHVLVEALATGTPIVSTNCKPGAEEVLNYGEFGKLSEVGNAEALAKEIINTLLLPQEQLEEMVEKGIKRAKEFAAKVIVKQYEKAFLQVVGHQERSKDRGDRL